MPNMSEIKRLLQQEKSNIEQEWTRLELIVLQDSGHVGEMLGLLATLRTSTHFFDLTDSQAKIVLELAKLAVMQVLNSVAERKLEIKEAEDGDDSFVMA